MKALLLGLACLLPSCVTLDHVRGARERLHRIAPQVEKLAKQYDMLTTARVSYCRSLDLPTEEERHSCMGPFAPDSELSKAMNQIQQNYNHAASDLAALEHALMTLSDVAPWR